MSLVLIFLILFFGLRPKSGHHENQAMLNPEKGYLAFYRQAIAFCDDIHLPTDKFLSTGFTIHLSIIPLDLKSHLSGRILVFYDGDNLRQLTIWHWKKSLIVMNGNDFSYAKRLPRITAKDALEEGKASFVSIVTSDGGTRLYIDGSLVAKSDTLCLNMPVGGQKTKLVLGNSVYGKNGWQGKMEGIAVYSRALNTERIHSHYGLWRDKKKLSLATADFPWLIYNFKDVVDDGVVDLAKENGQLEIPSHFIMLKKTVLSKPWNDFKLSRLYLIDVTLNFLAFVPLGAILYLCMLNCSIFGTRFTWTWVVIFCFFLSLGMEIYQIWLPERSSSLTDLFLNTIGAWFGVLLSTVYCKKKQMWRGNTKE